MNAPPFPFEPLGPTPWHDGEIAMQASVGMAARMAEVGRRSIRDHLTEQHQAFYPQLPFVVLGAVDPAGDVWATLRAGPPGFLGSDDPQSLVVRTPSDPADPADRGMRDGEPIGLLGIELSTRRRNRLNGTIHRTDPGGFTISVGQAFGNCPKYIQLRTPVFVRDPEAPPAAEPVISPRLDGLAQAIVAAADTVFVATYADLDEGHREVDVSHRGGRTGFVRIDADGVLTIPDFAGNLFFNTLGNIVANGRAGLAVADFATGDLVQLTGRAEVLLDSPEIATFQGAERLWRLTPTKVVVRRNAVPLRFDQAEAGWSPHVLRTGIWPGA